MTRADASMAESTPLLRDQAHSVPRRPPPTPDPLFDEFWAVYPRRVGKIGAQSIWAKVIRRGAAPPQIISAAERFRDECRASGTEKRFIPHPASWLRDGRYRDVETESEVTAAPPTNTTPPADRLSYEQVLIAVAQIAADQERPLTAAGKIVALIRKEVPGAQLQEFPKVDAERVRILARMAYPEYLQTPEWQARKKIMRARADNRCQVCNTSEKLHVHHRTYDRRGNERPEDLTVLCESCHDLFHANGKLVKEAVA